MQFQQLLKRALEIRKQYETFEKKTKGRSWSRSDIMEGFIGDMGDLMKLIMVKEGKRGDPKGVDEKLAHELSDCLWSIMVLSKKYDVNLEKSFLETMDYLEERLSKLKLHR